MNDLLIALVLIAICTYAYKRRTYAYKRREAKLGVQKRSGLDQSIESLVKLVKNVELENIDGVLSLTTHVVDYFKGLMLRKGKDVPFIADIHKIADLIHQAPQKNVGIFEATYNEDTNEIENYRALEADEMDPQLKSILGNEKLVVLN
ncbi:MAG: hypothetical protein K6G31_02130 [Paludibacteraceae bacterium]|nr:hypothetical protein [Paludibacteraceae bacterium]